MVRAARFSVLMLATILLTIPSLPVAKAEGVLAEIVLVDAAGREVRLDGPARRIVTNESLVLLSLALIDPDPVARIAGWARPQRLDPAMLAAFRSRFPAVDDIPEVGAVVPANLSLESILSVAPDLFVVSLWDPGWEEPVRRLEAAGIPVLFLDRADGSGRGPLEAAVLGIELLGRAIGRDEAAADFAAFIQSRYAILAERLDQVGTRPAVLVDVHAGSLCCHTPGSDNRITQYLELAGGRSIGAGHLPGYDGRLNIEFVLQADPEVYVGTGSPRFGSQGGIAVGAGIDAATARRSLRAVVGRNHLGELAAVRHGRVYGLSHQLAISALSPVAFECLVQWLHPGLFAELDPAATLAQVNHRFLAVPLEGTFCVGLRDHPADGPQ